MADFTHPFLVWGPRSGAPSEFLDETYPAQTTRGMGLLYGENCVILASTIFDWSTHVTDRQTDGIAMAYTRYSIYAVTRKKQNHTGKTNLDLLEQEIVSASDISWAICKSAPHFRHQHPNTQFFTGRMPFLPPNQQRQRSKHWRQICGKVCWSNTDVKQINNDTKMTQNIFCTFSSGCESKNWKTELWNSNSEGHDYLTQYDLDIGNLSVKFHLKLSICLAIIHSSDQLINHKAISHNVCIHCMYHSPLPMTST